MRADDLRHGRDERRITDLGAHAGNLLEHLVHAVGCLLDLELAHEVGHHAAGHLVAVDAHVGKRGDAALEALLDAHLLPVIGNLEEKVEVKAGIILGLLERGDDHLDGWLRIAESQRRRCSVDDGRTGLGRLDVVGGRHAADVVAVHVNRQADLLVEGLDQALRAIRREHARHVLDADGLGTKRLELRGVVDVGIKRVHRAHGVADGALEMRAALVERLGAVDDVADVVERVEDAEDVDAVAMGGLDEAIDDIARVMMVADEVLSAGEHLQGRVGAVLLDDAQTIPGVLVEEAQAGVEGRATPALQRVVADLVQLGKHGLHLGGGHTRGGLTLVAVAQNGIGNSNLRHICHLSNHNQPNILSSIPAAIAEPITPATLGPMACISRKLPGLAFWPST